MAVGDAEGDAEYCGFEDNSRSTKGAAVNRSCSSLSKSRTSPSKSCLLVTTVPKSCVPHTHAKIVRERKCTFHLFFPQRHVWTHTQTVPFCHAHVQNAIPLRISRDYG